MLYRGAQILILDEPTAVLTPQETEKLFRVMRNMRQDGKSIIIITHKLHEVLEISDRVAILRKGEYVGTVETAGASEASLTEMMVGKKVELNIERPEPVNPHLRLSVHNLSVTNAEGVRVLDNISFEAFSGEILGIAGISGNGQKELLEAIAGLQQTDPHSSVVYYPDDDRDSTAEQLIGKSPKDIRDMGVHLSFVPEDRLGMGLVGSMGMIGTFSHCRPPRAAPPGRRNQGFARRDYAVGHNACFPSLRRQCSEGSRRPRDCGKPVRADDCLRRSRP